MESLIAATCFDKVLQRLKCGRYCGGYVPDLSRLHPDALGAQSIGGLKQDDNEGMS